MVQFLTTTILTVLMLSACSEQISSLRTSGDQDTSSYRLDSGTPNAASKYQKAIKRGMATSWLKKSPFVNYSADILRDFKAKGFDHIRVRVSEKDYSGENLNILENVLNDANNVGLASVISWVNHDAELRASEGDKESYLNWWSDIANRLKGRLYNVSFNLFTEIGNESGLAKGNRYNEWTKAVVKRIRAIDNKRIIILSAPSKTVGSLKDISPKIYKNDKYMLVEWHLYASGPNKKPGAKHWEGTGSGSDKKNVVTIFKQAEDFSKKTGLPTYFGAWMPMDNNTAQLNQGEVESFARYFVKTAEEFNVPWTLNADHQFYNSAEKRWLETKAWGGLTLNMNAILNATMGLAGSAPEAPAAEMSSALLEEVMPPAPAPTPTPGTVTPSPEVGSPMPIYNWVEINRCGKKNDKGICTCSWADGFSKIGVNGGQCTTPGAKSVNKNKCRKFVCQ